MGTQAVGGRQPEDPDRAKWLLIAGAFVLGGAVGYFAAAQLATAPSGDDPILMAGGSLTIRGGPGGKFNVNGSDAVYTPANGKITRVDIAYHDASGLPAFASRPFNAAADNVQLTYCGSAQSCSSLTARSNPGGHGFVVSPVDGDNIPADANVFSHNPTTGYIDSVNIAGVTYGCTDSSGSHGKCTVVVHYQK